MAKQTFTTGQVLTAAQMTSLQQTAMLGGAASAKTASYTLVAADAGTAISMSSASATTITVNTSLFAAGDTVQITNLGAGVCTITAGTATVNTSASLALAQYESGTLDFTSTSAAIFIKGAGASAASGGMTLLASGSIAASATGVDISSISASYKDLVLYLTDWSGDATAQTAGTGIQLRFNNDSASNYNYSATISDSATVNRSTGAAGVIFANVESTANDFASVIKISNYADTTAYKLVNYTSVLLTTQSRNGGGAWFGTPAAINRVTVVLGTGAFDNGTYQLYGVN